MSHNFFRTLFFCILASMALLSAATILRWNPWMSMAAGVLPLIYYHLIFLKPLAKKGLTQPAIDSVYYFGFLVTVFALSISAITIAMGAEDVNVVIHQFGVGLLATGYAVVARMHLSSLTSNDDLSPELVLDSHLKRSRELVDTLEGASVQMAVFSQTLLSKTKEISDATLNSAETAMRDVARIFSDEMKASLALSREGLSEIRGLVSDTAFISERDELAKTIKATVASSKELNVAFDHFAEKARAASAVTQQSIEHSIALNNSLKTLTLNVAELGGDGGALNTSAVSLNTASKSISDGVVAMGQSIEQIAEMSDAVGTAGITFDRMRSASKKALTQIDDLGTVAEKLDAALLKVVASSEGAHSLAHGLEKVVEVLPGLAASVSLLSVNMDKASELSRALKSISDAVEVAVKQSMKLTESVSQASMGVEGVNALLSGATQLQNTVSSLQAVVSSLAGTVQAAQNAIGDSTTGLKSSIAASTAALELDVKRSSQAASLLTDQLIKVAQGIIDKTKERQGVPR
jgi:hypothetical protein